MQSVSENELVKQISICGQLIERKSAHLQEKNIDEEKLIACFDENEKAELKRLLDKLQAYWVEAHKYAHKKS